MKLRTLILAVALSTPSLAITPSLAMADPLYLGITAEPYLPFTMVEADGTWIGLEAELSNAICDKLADKCEIKSMAWNGLLPSLNADKIDFAVGTFAITPERGKTVDFSIPYYIPQSAIIGPKSDKNEFALVDASDGSGKVLDAKSFEGKVLGVQGASIQAKYAEKFLSGVSINNFDTADNNASDLVSHRNNYMLAALPFSKEFLKSPAGQNFEVKIILPNNPVLGNGIAYAMRKGDAATVKLVNDAMQQLIDDGTMKKIVDKWFDEQ